MATVAPEIPVLARDEAFEKLYRRYVKDVYHYALALLRNPADAEDVTQTTFLNAYRAYKRGEEIRKPQNWLIKIAHNVARSRYSQISRRVKEVPLEEHVDQLSLPDDEKPNVEGVLRALGRLPFNQRAALIMRELEGRSYLEIADTLDVSVAAVETLIFRARRSLRLRTAALRSILTVPVPTSLAQFFAQGGAGAAGGFGAGFLGQAAGALVVGGRAAAGGVVGGGGGGWGGEGGSEGGAAPHHAAGPPASTRGTAIHRHTVRAAEAHPRTHRAVSARRRAARASPSVTHRPASVAATPEPAESAPTSPSPSLPEAATVPAVVGTVDQVTASLPGGVPQAPQLPQLPVQAPPVPKLP